MLGIIAALTVVALDQLSKALVYGYLTEHGSVIAMTGFFNLVTAWNKGVSFSMFNNLGNYGVYILSAFALVVVCFLCYWLKKEESRFMQLALGFVIGGAIGNVIDRVRLGAVFDFLDFYVSGYHWPAFNVADSFICIGAFLIVTGGFCNCSAAKSKTSSVKSHKKEA